MGLDMYLYKARRLNTKELSNIKGKHVQDFEDYSFFNESDVHDNPLMFEDLMPYMQKVQMMESYYDIVKLKRENNIPENAEIVEQCYSKEITFCFKWGIAGKKEVTFGHNDYVITKSEGFYVVELSEVEYWRKEYGIQSEIHKSIGKSVENCGYYKLNESTIYRVTDEDYNGGTEDIFYHEWY